MFYLRHNLPLRASRSAARHPHAPLGPSGRPRSCAYPMGPAGARCSHRSFRVAEGQGSSAIVPWIKHLRHNGHAGRRAHDGAAEQRGPQERCWPRFGVGLLLRSSLRAIGRPSFSPTSARSNCRPPRSRRSAQPCPPTSTSESEPGCFNKHRVFVDYSLGSWLVSEASGTIVNCDSQFAKYH